MEYRVEELAAAAGVAVDTVRYYQTSGLLPPPRRVGRTAVYGDAHRQRIVRIRSYQAQGFKLVLIKRLLAERKESTAAALLEAVSEEGGQRSLSRAEVARRSGAPATLLAAVESAGLVQPMMRDGKPCYGEADVQMARAGMEIYRRGFPLETLLRLAVRHATHIDEIADESIELFDRFVRGKSSDGADPEEVAEVFRHLLPAVTTLVAQHFQRTVINRALRRLEEQGERSSIEAARSAVSSGRIEVSWR